MQALSILFQMRLPFTKGNLFPGMRRSGLPFILILNVEVFWQSLFPELSHPYTVTSIKTHEGLMDRDIGEAIRIRIAEKV